MQLSAETILSFQFIQSEFLLKTLHFIFIILALFKSTFSSFIVSTLFFFTFFYSIGIHFPQKLYFFFKFYFWSLTFLFIFNAT